MADEKKIVVDLNRITRRQFHDYLNSLRAVEDEGDLVARDEVNGAFAEQVVVSWPYKNEITMDGYLDLPFVDSVEVDNAVDRAMKDVREKKSVSGSGSLPSSGNL